MALDEFMLDADDGAAGAACVRFVADQAIVALSGEHDMATVELVDDAFAVAEAARPALVVVDLSACRFIDSTVLRALILARERADAEGRRVVLVRGLTTPSTVDTLLRVSGLDDVFESYPTVEDALGRGDRVRGHLDRG